MDNIEDIIKESKEILDKVHENRAYKNTSTVDLFRTELLNFIGSQLDPIRKTQDIIDLIDAEIIKKLILHDYDKKELLDLRRELIQSSNVKTSVLLEPFKPTNTSGNPLIPPPIQSDSNNEEILKKLSPNERIAIDKLYRLLKEKSNGDKQE